MAVATVLLGLFAAGPAQATAVSIIGLFKNKAMISIDGGDARLVAVGQSVQGVKLVSANSSSAEVEIDGKRSTLVMGQSFAAVGSKGSGAHQAVLAADPQGHFATSGMINGNAVNFLVDTGATSVTMQAADARRMDLDYKSGEMVGISTANGVVPAWRVKLSSVRVGDITMYGVDGLVVESSMTATLLGMSFLNRTNMNREGQTLTLTQRY